VIFIFIPFYAYCGNNPVMYSDISGESAVLLICAILFVMSTILIASTSPSAEYISEQPVLIDVSISFIFFKVGISAVIDFQDEYIEFYSHYGGYKGLPGGSLSIGTVYNYDDEGDFRGLFINGEIGYFIGINHSSDPRDVTDNVKSSSIVFSTGPLIGVGGDYYWHLKKLTYDWS
jgi:hypothetical protein